MVARVCFKHLGCLAKDDNKKLKNYIQASVVALKESEKPVAVRFGRCLLCAVGACAHPFGMPACLPCCGGCRYHLDDEGKRVYTLKVCFLDHAEYDLHLHSTRSRGSGSGADTQDTRNTHTRIVLQYLNMAHNLGSPEAKPCAQDASVCARLCV